MYDMSMYVSMKSCPFVTVRMWSVGGRFPSSWHVGRVDGVVER